MKHKADIDIGGRFVDECCRLFPDLTMHSIAKQLGCSRWQLNEWRHGKTPGGYYLAKIHAYGGDVAYILSGKRTNDNALD